MTMKAVSSALAVFVGRSFRSCLILRITFWGIMKLNSLDACTVLRDVQLSKTWTGTWDLIVGKQHLCATFVHGRLFIEKPTQFMSENIFSTEWCHSYFSVCMCVCVSVCWISRSVSQSRRDAASAGCRDEFKSGEHTPRNKDSKWLLPEVLPGTICFWRILFWRKGLSIE